MIRKKIKKIFKKFTFKTDKATGMYRSFHPDHIAIKLNKIKCGGIDDKRPHQIRLQVIKKDIMEDGNPNCKWRNILLKKESNSLQEAKNWLNAPEILKIIHEKYTLYLEE